MIQLFLGIQLSRKKVGTFHGMCLWASPILMKLHANVWLLNAFLVFDKEKFCSVVFQNLLLAGLRKNSYSENSQRKVRSEISFTA